MVPVSVPVLVTVPVWVLTVWEMVLVALVLVRVTLVAVTLLVSVNVVCVMVWLLLVVVVVATHVGGVPVKVSCSNATRNAMSTFEIQCHRCTQNTPRKAPA